MDEVAGVLAASGVIDALAAMDVTAGTPVRSRVSGLEMVAMPAVRLDEGSDCGPALLVLVPGGMADFSALVWTLGAVPEDVAVAAAKRGDEAALIGNGAVGMTGGGCVQLRLPDRDPVCVVNVYGQDGGHAWDWEVLSSGRALVMVLPMPVFGRLAVPAFATLPADLDEGSGSTVPCGPACVTVAGGAL